MIKGCIKEIDWGSYLAPNFNVKLPKDESNWEGCGSATLSLITHINPKIIDTYCPNKKKLWSTKAFTNFLIKRRYVVISITKNNVTNVDWGKHPLKFNHCLAINAQMDRKEASWFLLHKKILWHNLYQEDDYSPLFFLNKPTQDVLLIWSPKWK